MKVDLLKNVPFNDPCKRVMELWSFAAQQVGTSCQPLWNMWSKMSQTSTWLTYMYWYTFTYVRTALIKITILILIVIIDISYIFIYTYQNYSPAPNDIMFNTYFSQSSREQLPVANTQPSNSFPKRWKFWAFSVHLLERMTRGQWGPPSH